MGVFSDSYAGQSFRQGSSFFDLLTNCVSVLAAKGSLTKVKLVAREHVDDGRNYNTIDEDVLLILDGEPLVAVQIEYRQSVLDSPLGSSWGQMALAGAVESVDSAKSVAGDILERLGQSLQGQVKSEKPPVTPKEPTYVLQEARWAITLRWVAGRKNAQWSGTVFEQGTLDSVFTALAEGIIEARKVAAAKKPG